MTNVEESRRRALALASRAPSAHNTQPWRVRASGNRLLVHADEGRWLRHTDPLRRDLGLALGGFCEALRIALHAEGAGVELRRTEGTFAELIVEGSAAPAPAEASLLRQRQTSRLLYAATPPPGPALAQLEAAARAGGLRLHLAAGTERASLDEWFFAAARESWLDDRAVGELRAWTRLDPTGRFSADDGLSARCLELGAAETLGMGALMAPPLRAALHRSFLAPLAAEQAARAELRLVAGAPVLAIVVAEAHSDPLARGAGLLRLWLEAAGLHLAMQPLSVLLDRRGWEVARHLGVDTRQLVAALRIGYSAPPPLSRRRPVTAWFTT